ncbi:MAG TPA: lysophospholipid acyltransferase family protein [Anaerolineales bacterium]|nr:lysophospholipid acyltransferase family protein [Anaerolineales bacterium]
MTERSFRSSIWSSSGYDHGRWETRRRVLRFLIRNIGFRMLAKVDRVEGVENVPAQGPAIMMINHINFIDPFAVINALPRNIVPMAKVEVYNYPIVGIFPRIYGVIPVQREEFDRRAIQGAMEVLRAGEIILVAPEAHRGPQLREGKEGVAYLATRANAPIVPVAIDGTIGFPTLFFLPRWREPGAMIKFGKPFRFKTFGQRAGRDMLRQMTDEAMYILAGMLPEYRRGVYADLSQATQETIEWV